MIGLMVELNGIPTYVENTDVINIFKNSSKFFASRIMFAMKMLRTKAMLTAQKNPDMMRIVMVACLLAGSEFARLFPPPRSFTTEIIKDMITTKIISDISEMW